MEIAETYRAPGAFNTTNVYQRDGTGARGGLIGALAGADVQFAGRFVAGAFVDFDRHNWTSQFHFDSHELHWGWSAGARLGYLTAPSTLLFVSAGYSQVQIEHNVSTLTGGAVPLLKDRHQGYFVGGGIETILGHGLSLRGEYRHTQFDDVATSATSFIGPHSWSREAHTQTARLSLNYRLGLLGQ